MSLSIRLLGTSASRPTVERNVSSLAIHREGETLMFDCGEGTQRQMMRYGVSFALEDIFFTHMHADHLLGVIGLMRTMALQGRTERLRLWGPRGAARVLKRAEGLGFERDDLPVEILELDAGQRLERAGLRDRRLPRRPPRLGVARLRDRRRRTQRPIQSGPGARARNSRRADVGTDPSRLVGNAGRRSRDRADGARWTDKRPGRTVVITGDTRPCAATIEASRDADLLIHEATFGDEEAERAVETGHSTAREAAQVAREAGVRRLVLTHFSARYSRDAGDLEREAQAAVFSQTLIGKDGMEIDVPFRE